MPAAISPTMASTWRDAVRVTRGGLELDIEVHPGASHSTFPAGFNTWRRRLRAQVRAPPQDGAANEELVALIAGFFQVAPRHALLVSGGTQRQKRIRLTGIEADKALQRLGEALDER